MCSRVPLTQPVSGAHQEAFVAAAPDMFLSQPYPTSHAMVSVVAAVSVKNAVLVVLEALLIRLDGNRDWLTRHGNSECRLVVVRH